MCIGSDWEGTDTLVKLKWSSFAWYAFFVVTTVLGWRRHNGSFDEFLLKISIITNRKKRRQIILHSSVISKISVLISFDEFFDISMYFKCGTIAKFVRNYHFGRRRTEVVVGCRRRRLPSSFVKFAKASSFFGRTEWRLCSSSITAWEKLSPSLLLHV